MSTLNHDELPTRDGSSLVACLERAVDEAQAALEFARAAEKRYITVGVASVSSALAMAEAHIANSAAALKVATTVLVDQMDKPS